MKIPMMNGEVCLVPLRDNPHVPKYLGSGTTYFIEGYVLDISLHSCLYPVIYLNIFCKHLYGAYINRLPCPCNISVLQLRMGDKFY